MKIICNRNYLYEAVMSVQKAVSNKAILPILEGILVTAGNNTVVLTGNDLEIAIQCTIEAKTPEEGSIVLSSRIFSEIVKRLPDNEIEIKTYPDYRVEIDCLNSHFEIKGLNPEGFPHIPAVDKSKSIVINNETLKDMIKKTIFSVSSDEKMPVLTGALLESSENSLSMVTIDGYRMSLRKEYVLGTNPGLKIIVPGKALSELYRLIRNEGDNVSIYYEKNQILFDFGSFIMVSKLLQGEYINYKSIYPENYDAVINVNTVMLSESVERASLVINEEKKSPVDFSINDEELIITSKTEIGNVTERVSMEKEGNDMNISFNSRYLQDILKNIDDEKIKMSFSGSIGPCVIEPVEGNEFSYVVLPVRTS
jgi:DNA polymerase III subunit beta